MAPVVATTALLGQFLVAVNGFVLHDNATQLGEYLVLEPPFGTQYVNMIAELRQAYPPGKEEALEEKCEQILTAAREGVNGSATWTAFIRFMAQYLAYLRDVDMDQSKYLDTYNLLSTLQTKVNSALGHNSLGHLVLPTVISCAKLVCRLAIGLDRQPELIAHLKRSNADGEDEGVSQTLPERAANTIRFAISTCLNDRSTAHDASGRPSGRKRGIYTIANICLKILFQCRKTRNATMIFENIGLNSPQLSLYPKSERITYLTYLGRYLFQTGHFYRALLALDAAYTECPLHAPCTRQRRFILVYLTTCNLILGRLPTAALYSRPEALHFATHFDPIAHALRTGDLTLFRSHLSYDSPSAPWLLHFRILLPLRNRAEVHVWRSLVRHSFRLVGAVRSEGTSAPNIRVQNLVNAFRFVDARALASSSSSPSSVDPDFSGAVDYVPPTPASRITVTAVESILASLIDQGLLKGFIAHRRDGADDAFAVSGAKATGGDGLRAGFPSPWSVLCAKADAEVPGWRTLPQAGAGAGGGGGRVVKMRNVKGVGAG
jgi:hypothetical protein